MFYIRLTEKMNRSIRIQSIIRILGHLVVIEGLLMLLPMAVCLAYGEDDWRGFAVAAAAAVGAGGGTELFTRRATASIRAREGFIITASVWIVFGLFGLLPLMLSADPLSFTDGMFEVISGFTTTGATMIMDVDAQSHGVLFWRALTQWIGGLGIVFFMLAVLPEFNKAVGISMFNAEATGITHTKLHPRIRQTAISLWGVYVVLTIVSILLLWAGPMNLFDSTCQTFAAVATGGFTTHNAGIAYWDSDYVYWVLSAVMFVAGLNFMLLYGAWREDFRLLLRNDVLRGFTVTVTAAYLLFLLSGIISGDAGADRLLVYPVFHIISAITSTGFSIAEVEGWGEFTVFMTIMLMLCGACTGSTAGGLKIDRLIVLARNFRNEIKKTVFPKHTYVVSLNGSALQSCLVSRISAFVTLYMIVVLVSTGIITLFGYTFTDSLFMVSSCIGCNGLGYGATGVNGAYALLPDAVKWLLVVDMLVGRLELFTFLVLLLPSFWRR